MDPMGFWRRARTLPSWADRATVRRAACAAAALSVVVLSIFLSEGVLAAVGTGVLGVVVGRWQRPTEEPRHPENRLAGDRTSIDSVGLQDAKGDPESDLGKQVAKLQSIATKDPLTGLSNRAGLETFIEHRLRVSNPGRRIACCSSTSTALSR